MKTENDRRMSIGSKSNPGRTELLHTVRRAGDPIIIEPLCIGKVDIDDPIFDEINYYVRRINFIMPTSTTPSNMASEVLRVCNHILGIKEVSKVKREKSEYFVNDYEKQRLILQGNFALKFDHDVYEKVISGFECPAVLDVGCARGNLIMDRLSRYSKDHIVVGVDLNPSNIEDAVTHFGDEKTRFLVGDLESDDFIDDVLDALDELGREKFDIINLSMVLLHIQNMGKLLRKLKRMLSDNGYLIIIDVDDGLNMYSPDPMGLFTHMDELFAKDRTAGNRFTGREIYPTLVNAGYSRITLEKCGRSTVNYTPEEKEQLWTFSFAYLKEDYREMLSNDPENRELAEDLEWIEQNFDNMKGLYSAPEFNYFDGKMAFTAQK